MIIFIYDGTNAADLQNHYYGLPGSHYKKWKMILASSNTYMLIGNRICKKGEPIILNEDGSYFMDLKYLDKYDQ